MPTTEVDVGRILTVLERHQVVYVVIGGFAAELHDVAIPPTRDVDITPQTGRENLQRLAAALNELGARLRVAGGPADGIPMPGGITSDWLAGMVSAALVTSAGPLDVALLPDGTTGYDGLRSAAVIVSYEGHDVPVAALEDVLRSKEAAGRPKDLLVIPALRDHLRRNGPG